MTDISSVASRIKGPRKTILGPQNSLEGVITYGLADGALCYVTASKQSFQLQLTSQLSPNGTTVIAPIAGPGRWILQSGGGGITIPFPVDYIDATSIDDGQIIVATGGVAMWGDVPAAFDITGFSHAGSSLVQVGATITNPAFTASYNQAPSSAVLTDTEGHTDNVTSTPTSFTSPHSVTKNTFGASWNFTLTASSSLGTDAAGTGFTWGQNVFYGAQASGTINEAFIKALTPALKLNPSGDYAINAGAGQFAYFCALTEIGLTTSSFIVAGFPLDCSKVGSAINVTQNGVTMAYDVFGSTNSGLGPFDLEVND